ncbi:MAG: serine/threonine-protein kinase [Gemmatales bacterium]
MNQPLDSHLEDGVLSYLNALDRGSSRALADCLERHADIASRLKSMAKIDHLVHDIASHVAADQADESEGTDEESLRQQIEKSGRYACISVLGQGGMGTVLLGRDKLLDRRIAIKFLRKKHRSNPRVVERFFDEVHITADLQHPGIPPVYDLGVTESGCPYMVMRLIQGRTLSELLSERTSLAEHLPQMLGIFHEIAQTMAYAHSRQILHRDLKPQNIMSGAFGEVQVMDWGLAKRLGSTTDETFIDQLHETPVVDGGTVAGAIIGTPRYMSPEQAKGRHDLIDCRCDVYGLGAILCEILTGHPPEEHHPLGGLHTTEVPSETFRLLEDSAADPALILLTKQCLSSQPANRPPDGQAVATAVARYQEAVEARLRQVEIVQVKTKESLRRQRTTYFFMILILVLVLAGLGVLLKQQSEANVQLSQKNQELLQANGVAQERFHLALDAVNRFHSDVSKDVLLKDTQFKHLRAGCSRKLLISILGWKVKPTMLPNPNWRRI